LIENVTKYLFMKTVKISLLYLYFSILLLTGEWRQIIWLHWWNDASLFRPLSVTRSYM